MKKCLILIMGIVVWSFVVSANSPYDQPRGLPKVKLPVFRNDSFSIVKFGAKADGITINTKSIQSAIDACSAKGGGVVVIPSGIWVTGPIVLKNNTNLHLKRDAILLFSKDFDQYPI